MPEKKVDIFKDANRDLGMEKVEKNINKISDNGKNPGALFEDEKKNENNQVDTILDMFGGKVIDEKTGQDTGYRSPKQIEAEKQKSSLKSLLDTPEPEKQQKNVENDTTAPNSAILEEALSLIKDGRSVIPVGVDKRPLINWKEFHSRIATEDEIRGWFEKWPEAQLGLVTGKISRLAVVDVEKEFGDYTRLGLPETMVSRTGSGGYHLFYTYVDGVRNKAKINNQEVDIRGEGGYVVVPPSSNVNGKYEWIKKVEGDLPAFPVNIFPPEKPVERGEAHEVVLDYNINEYPGFSAGQRNDEITRFVGSLLTKLHPDFWENIGWPMVENANEKNDPPLNGQELRRTFDSICQKEATGDYERWWNKQREEEKDQRMAMLDSIEGDEIVELKEAADKIRSLNPQTYPTGFALFDSAMKGGFKEGDLIIVSGLSGHGKTTLGQTFTYHMIKKELPVLWFSYEVSADILDEKFQAMNVPNQYKVYVPEVTASGDMLWVEKKIKEAIKKFNVKCIFVDLIDFLNPKEQKRSDNEALVLRRITSELKNIARENRIVMFVMAHVRKQKDDRKALENQDIAHSSSIVQLSDYVFMIERSISGAKKKEEALLDADGNPVKARKEIEYSTFSRIRMTKNRYTGMLVGEFCELGKDERFHTNAPSAEREIESPEYFHK